MPQGEPAGVADSRDESQQNSARRVGSRFGAFALSRLALVSPNALPCDLCVCTREGPW